LCANKCQTFSSDSSLAKLLRDSNLKRKSSQNLIPDTIHAIVNALVRILRMTVIVMMMMITKLAFDYESQFAQRCTAIRM